MHYEFQPLLTISKGVGRGFKLLVVWPGLEVNIQPPATFPHLVVGVLHQTFTHFGGCGKGVGSGGSNVCFSYFLLIEKKMNEFWVPTTLTISEGWKGWGWLGPNFLPIPERLERVGVQMFGFFSYFCWLKKIKGIWVQATFDNFKRGGKVEGSSFWTKKMFSYFLMSWTNLKGFEGLKWAISKGIHLIKICVSISQY